MAFKITKNVKEFVLEAAGKDERRREEKLKLEKKELLKERSQMAKKYLNVIERTK